MTPQIYSFVESLGLKFDGNSLEFGSLDVNGSIKYLFTGPYLGVDMQEGKGVDLVCSTHAAVPPPELQERFGKCDTVLCLDMLEHDKDPFGTVSGLRKYCKEGSYIVITAPGITFPRHDYPSDYWRFTGDGVKVLLDSCSRPGDTIKVVESSQHVFAFMILGESL